MEVATILALDSFIEKIEDAISLVHAMDAEEKLKAVQYWNVVSERLQDILNHSVEDIGALAFQMEGEKLPDYIDASQLVSLGMAPAFLARYISKDEDATGQGRCGRTYKHVNGHLIVADAVTNVDILNCTDIPHVTLEVDTRIREAQVAQVALEEVDMGAEETVEDVIKKGDEEGRPSPTQEVTELQQNGIPHEMQAVKVGDESVDIKVKDDDFEGNGNIVHLMITANAQAPSKNLLVQRVPKRSQREWKEGKGGVEDAGNFQCVLCARTFHTNSQLTTHSWTHSKPYSCTDCDARFSTKGNLIVHRRRHSGERPYTCQNCDSSFSTKGNLKRHVKSHSGEKPWECTVCHSRFTEKKSLKIHMRRHTGERPYQCNVCLKRFSQTSILQSHLAMHLNQRAHLCNLCGKSFRQKSQLRLHEQRHAGVRKYQCPHCDFKFLMKGDMERHRRVHTGERPFKCEECSKTFTRQQSLIEHMNRHWGVKPYQCKYCKKGFVEMSACHKHVKAHERAKLEVQNGKAKGGRNVQKENRISPSTTDSGKLEQATQARSPVLEVPEEDRSTSTSTVVIQRVPKSAITYSNTKNSNIRQLLEGKASGENNAGQGIDLTDVNLLASASTFQE